MTLAACSVSRRCCCCASSIACSSWTLGSADSSSFPESLAPRYFHQRRIAFHISLLLYLQAILCRAGGGRSPACLARLVERGAQRLHLSHEVVDVAAQAGQRRGVLGAQGKLDRRATASSSRALSSSR